MQGTCGHADHSGISFAFVFFGKNRQCKATKIKFVTKMSPICSKQEAKDTISD